jgi:hypothetical protein
LGAVIQLASGLSPEDRVIPNPPDGVAEGDPVHLIESPSSATGTGKAGTPHDKG